MLDKSVLTRKRLYWANRYFNNTDLHPLEKKYGNCLYTPLDIPLIELNDSEKFIEYYFNNAKKSVKLKADVSTSATSVSSFLSIDGVPTSESSIWSKNYVPSIRTEFKELFDQILDYFPINSLDNFIIWSSTAGINFHRDESIMLDLPVHFRIMLHNPNDTSTLYIKSDKIKPLVIPKETNSFAWNNLRITHGSELKEPKILFLFGDPLDVDWKKYDHLIERSISKYKKFVIEDTTTDITHYVNI